MGDVNLIDSNVTENWQAGFLNITYTEIYRVIMDTRDATPFQVLIEAGIPPQLGNYVTPAGERVHILSRVPRRVGEFGTTRKWNVTVVYSNNQQEYLRDSNGAPVADPVDAVKEVDITYEEISVPIVDAKLIEATENWPLWDPGATPAPLTGTKTIEERKTRAGPITNSAGVVVPDQFEDSYRKRITVWRYLASWPASFETFLGRTNSDSVTITEVDGGGTTYQETFAARKLKCKNIIKQNFWYNGTLYYRIGIVLDVSPNLWIHVTVDEGTERLVYEGQIDPWTGDPYTQSELNKWFNGTNWDSNTIALRPIMTWVVGDDVIVDPLSGATPNLGVAVQIGEPMLFDGKGNEKREGSPYDRLFLNWETKPPIPFAPLNL